MVDFISRLIFQLDEGFRKFIAFVSNQFRLSSATEQREWRTCCKCSVSWRRRCRLVRSAFQQQVVDRRFAVDASRRGCCCRSHCIAECDTRRRRLESRFCGSRSSFTLFKQRISIARQLARSERWQWRPRRSHTAIDNIIVQTSDIKQEKRPTSCGQCELDNITIDCLRAGPFSSTTNCGQLDPRNGGYVERKGEQRWDKWDVKRRKIFNDGLFENFCLFGPSLAFARSASWSSTPHGTLSRPTRLPTTTTYRELLPT